MNEIDEIINKKSEPTEEELDNFKNLVNDWFKYDDTIRKLQIAIKERKSYQRVLNNKIQDFMFKYKYNDLNTQNGRIKANIKTVPKPINIKDIKNKIIEFKSSVKSRCVHYCKLQQIALERDGCTRFPLS